MLTRRFYYTKKLVGVVIKGSGVMDFRSSQSGSNARRYPEPTRASAQATENNVSATGAQGDSAEAPRTTMQRSSDQKPRKPLMLIVAIIAIIVLIGGSWFAWMKMAGGDTGVKGGQYQAVFLTNGQVYFGKVSDINSGYVKLSDIYYLQVQQSVQPDSKKTTDDKDQSQVSLAKLGSELHGPEDTMYISRQQVLFWENLKNDGKVVQAINSYKQQNK